VYRIGIILATQPAKEIALGKSPSSLACLEWWPKHNKNEEPPGHCVLLRVFATQPISTAKMAEGNRSFSATTSLKDEREAKVPLLLSIHFAQRMLY